MPKVRLQELDEYKDKSNFKKIKPKKKSEKDYFEEVEKKKS